MLPKCRGRGSQRGQGVTARSLLGSLTPCNWVFLALFSPGEQNLPGAAGAQCGCLEMPTATGVPNWQGSTPKVAHPLCGSVMCCSHPVATRLCLAITPHPGDFGVLMGLFVPCWEDAAACIEASPGPSLWGVNPRLISPMGKKRKSFPLDAQLNSQVKRGNCQLTRKAPQILGAATGRSPCPPARCSACPDPANSSPIVGGLCFACLIPRNGNN